MNRGLALAAGGIAVGLALAALATTCLGPDETTRTWAASTSLEEQCGGSPENALRVVVDAPDGFELGAATTAPLHADSNGPVVVLRHGASHTLCDWLSWAAGTSNHTGATFLLMDRRGQGSSPGRSDLTRDPEDVKALVEAAGSSRETRELVVLGSSMGNASAFSLLEHLPKAPCAVVAVSPVPGVGPLDGVASLRATDPPHRPGAVHLVWAAGDGNVPAHATELGDAARFLEVPVSQLEVTGATHARAVLDRHAKAQRFVEDALLSCG